MASWINFTAIANLAPSSLEYLVERKFWLGQGKILGPQTLLALSLVAMEELPSEF